MSTPLVSIVIPAFNAAPFVEQAIRSVLAQTVADLEVILVNDGSTDDTASIARSIGDERLLVIDRPNQGVSVARNVGLESARGEHIGFLDADDAMEPTNLAEKLAALQRTDARWVYGDLLLCDAGMQPSGSIMRGTDGDVVRTILLGIDPAVPASCSNALLHRSCFATGFRFDPELSNAADQHFALVMAKEHTYHHLPNALNRYRVLPKSMSRNVDLYAADHRRLMAKAMDLGLLDDPDLRKEVLSNAEWSIGGSYWKNAGTPVKALPYLLRAVAKDPSILMRKLRPKGR